MFYTYVLISLKDRKHYIGCAVNIEGRFREHAKGNIEATRNGRPLKLVYYEACLSKAKAIKREKYFKTGFGRRFLKNRL